jgi:hypothetical protein
MPFAYAIVPTLESERSDTMTDEPNEAEAARLGWLIHQATERPLHQSRDETLALLEQLKALLKA